MTVKERRPGKESWAEFVGMDQLDLVIIVLAVVASTFVKYQHWFDGTVPNWVLDFVLPFLLILAAYKVRGWQRARKKRLAHAKRRPPKAEESSGFRDDE
jgi:hypothetical protein